MRAHAEAAADRDEVQQIAARSVAKLTKSGDIRMENMIDIARPHVVAANCNPRRCDPA